MMDWREDNKQALVAQRTVFQPWQFCLYIAGDNPPSVRVLTNPRTCCEQHLAGQHALKILDVQQPALARRDQLVARPLLVCRQPDPRQYLSGDLSDPERLLQRLFTALPC